jgi:hypothetical protein
MIISRGFVHVPTVLLCAMLADARAQPKPESAIKPEATAVLAKVRETYRNLTDYHFERVLLAQEATEGGKPENIAELTLSIASEHAKWLPDNGQLLPINLDRFRLGTKTKRSEMLQMCDGRICWAYTSAKNEYMTGQRLRDVASSVGGSFMLGVHLFAFMTLEEGALQDAKVAREEEVQVGNGRRKCYVVEGAMQPPPRPRPDGPPPSGRPGVDWFLFALGLQGLAGAGERTSYSAWPPDENAAGVAEPTHVTLWIDQNAHVVVRSTMSAQLYKRRADRGGQSVDKVAVSVTDSFTTATIGTPPDAVFRFTPPEEAKEVPNAASRRQKQ